MAFLIMILRAVAFLVVLPLLAYVAARMLLPWRGFVIPMAGSFDLPNLAALIVFAAGFLAWAQHPTGRSRDDSDDPEAFAETEPGAAASGPDGEERPPA